MVLAAYVSQITKKSKTSDEFMSHNQDKATMLCTELHEECQEKFGEALAKPAEEDQEPRDYECQIQAYAQCDAPFKLVKGCYDESFARYSALVKMTTHKTCKAMANESAALSKPTNTESPQCWQLYDQCPKVAQWISGIGRGLQMISCGGEAPQQGLKEGDNSTGSDSEKQEPSPPGVS